MQNYDFGIFGYLNILIYNPELIYEYYCRIMLSASLASYGTSLLVMIASFVILSMVALTMALSVKSVWSYIDVLER